MKNFLLAATLGLTALSANATCPASISGKYAGTGQYTEQDFINGTSVITYVEYHVLSVTISNSSILVNRAYYAATGANGPAAPDATGAAPFTFDRSTCSGQMGSNADPLIFVVSDNGNKINFIHGKTPNSSHLSAELWELSKQ